MKKVCVLFGAGADAPLGILTGGDFASSVLGISKKLGDSASKMNDAIASHYKGIITSTDPWYPNYFPLKWDEKSMVKASLRRKNLEEGKKIDDDAFDNKVDDLFKPENDAEKKTLTSQYPSYMGLIDSKFQTLIAPKTLGQRKFWQVVSCYCRAYLTIVSQILERDDYENLLNPTKEIIDDICNASKKAANDKDYYSVISKVKSSNDIDISVVTTNYTYYCETISGLDRKKNMAYVHGRIGLFESPRDLCVYDLAEGEDISGEIVFPYMFIQSAVKPIVERLQIIEYAKMVGFMDTADKIILLGYQLNYDDNHINSIIRSEVMKGKEVVYLSYNDEKNKYLELSDLQARLRLHSAAPNLACRVITNADSKSAFEEELTK